MIRSIEFPFSRGALLAPLHQLFLRPVNRRVDTFLESPGSREDLTWLSLCVTDDDPAVNRDLRRPALMPVDMHDENQLDDDRVM